MRKIFSKKHGNRILSCLCMATLLITCLSIHAFAFTKFVGRVDYSSKPGWTSLTLRAGPGTKNDVVYEMKNGAEVLVLGETNGWYQLETKDPQGNLKKGYASSKYIVYVKDYVEPSIYPYIGKVATESSNLNLRKTPNTNGTLLTSIPKGTEIKVLQSVPGENTDYDWLKIEWGSQSGYVASKYVQYVRPADEKPNPPDPPPEPPAPPTPPLEFESLPHSTVIPDFYKPYLEGFQKEHPNWQFVFYYSDIDFQSYLANQSNVYTASNGHLSSKSLVEKQFPISYRNPKYKDTPIESGRWYAADPKTVAYFLDPRNALDSVHIFQFEDVSYNPSVHTIQGVEACLRGSFMANKTIQATDGRTVTYAQAIMDAAAQSGASPYHIASRIIQENGKNGSGTTSGVYAGYEGYYNFFNIGANTHGSVVANALSFAKDAAGERTYGRPWDTPYKAIVEGAKWLSSKYIAKKQETLYYQKFDLVPPKPGNHQYMTNISAPYGESTTVYRMYKDMGVLDYPFVFKLPVFKNMPSVQHLPDFDTKDYYGRMRGDATGDGMLTAADYAQLSATVKSGSTAKNGQQFIAQDMNDDMALDAFDLALLDRLITN